MGDMRYSGKYARFDTENKKMGSILNSADCIVGDTFDIVFKVQDDVDIAWIRNRFGHEVGFLDPRTSRELAIMKARGWTLRALLSFVAYTSQPKPESYWGEVALICNHPQYDQQVNEFAKTIGDMMADAKRPNINLEKTGIDAVISSNGAWKPKKSTPRPEMKSGTAVVKDRRQVNEGIVEMARDRKIGCYIVSWAFIIAVVGIIVFVLLKLFGVV